MMSARDDWPAAEISVQASRVDGESTAAPEEELLESLWEVLLLEYGAMLLGLAGLVGGIFWGSLQK